MSVFFVRLGQVLGLVGTNGIGKSTALKILAGWNTLQTSEEDIKLHSKRVEKIENCTRNEWRRSGKLKPNLGRYENPPEWREILDHFRGSELQAENYTRNEWRRCETTLETSWENVNRTRFEWRRSKTTLVSSGEHQKQHSFRGEKIKNYTRFEWGTQNYFLRVLDDKLKAVIKPQYVDQLAKAVTGKVGDILKRKDERGDLLHSFRV